MVRYEPVNDWRILDNVIMFSGDDQILDPSMKLGRSVRFVCNVNIVNESFV